MSIRTKRVAESLIPSLTILITKRGKTKHKQTESKYLRDKKFIAG
jgi:hypothetical protein